VAADPERPGHGLYRLSNGHKIRDEAPPGDFNFKKAFIHSSNSYFVNYGLKVGAENIVRVGREFHLGERTGLFPGHETGGNFPTLAEVQSSDWRAGETANLSIGQGDIDVTPMQMAVMVSAIANDGNNVFWPRLVQRVEPLDAGSGQTATNFPAGRVRDRVAIHPHNLNLLRAAMLADVEEKDGTGTSAAVPGITICGKTGTAQVQDSHGHETGRNLWFASYAPYENPRYAVVVMVESSSGGFGGTVCAPIAHDIYAAIVKKESPSPARTLAARE
jgi:penicillin-binding protein 2